MLVKKTMEMKSTPQIAQYFNIKQQNSRRQHIKLALALVLSLALKPRISAANSSNNQQTAFDFRLAHLFRQRSGSKGSV
jgi:hypothetical protein